MNFGRYPLLAGAAHDHLEAAIEDAPPLGDPVPDASLERLPREEAGVIPFMPAIEHHRYGDDEGHDQEQEEDVEDDPEMPSLRGSGLGLGIAGPHRLTAIIVAAGFQALAGFLPQGILAGAVRIDVPRIARRQPGEALLEQADFGTLRKILSCPVQSHGQLAQKTAGQRSRERDRHILRYC
ncbi:hypothetical protein [uncultured Methylobacterium sp.]|uniref:hypothetical protein n=1 Tax=uncultured Methylobacterium sp. TaxID=157278 RepID=UPI0035CC7785